MTVIGETDIPNKLLGGDSSLWDDIPETPYKPDFSIAYQKGWVFNYLKATQGTFVDRSFKQDFANCRKTPLYLGMYHFLQWDISPRKQAEFFFKTVEKDQGDLPLVCDFEWWKGTVPSDAFDRLYNFLERMKQLTNHKLGIYTGYYFWLDYGKKDDYWKQYSLWLAQYSKKPPKVPKPWNKYDIWQFTDRGDGRYYGMESRDVDLNYFMGTRKEFMEYLGLDSDIIIPEPIEPEKPVPDGDNDMLKMVVVSDGLNVRKGPNTGQVIVTKLNKGDIVTVYDVAGVQGSWVNISNESNEWCCVQNINGIYLKKV